MRIQNFAREYDYYLSDDYEKARNAANDLVQLGIESQDRFTEARGLVRLAFLELISGKWGNDWEEKLKRSEELVEDSGTTADGELHTYRGTMRGVWLGRLDEGVEDLRYAIRLLGELREDYSLVQAHGRIAWLYNLKADAILAMSNAYMSFEIATELREEALLGYSLGLVLKTNAAANVPEGENQGFIQRALQAGMPTETLAGMSYVEPPNLEELRAKVLAVIGKGRNATPREKVRAVNWSNVITSDLHRKGEYLAALEWAKRGVELAEEIQDSTTSRTLRLRIANLNAMGIGEQSTAQVLPTTEEYLPLSGALLATWTHALRGDSENARDWSRHVLDRLATQRQDSSQEVLYTVQSSRGSDLAKRASMDAIVLEKDRFNRMSLMLVAGVVFVAAVPLLWRYREKGQMLKSIRKEVLQREEEQQRNAELVEQLVAVQRLEAAGTLAASVAHDVNNSLMVVVGFTDLAASEQDHERRQDYLGMVMDAANIAANTTRGLLTFARMESSESVSLDLVDVLSDSHALLSRVATASVGFELRIGPETSVFCRGDRNKLQQVVMNLVLNARDAVGPAGRIVLSLTCDSKSATVCVEDDGPGIPHDIQEKIFEPFYSTKARGKGTGLGLSIVHGIVQDHGGSIHVDSAPGEGTKMTVVLPVIEEQPHAAVGQSDYDGKGRLLLVAEDDPKVMAVLEQYLKRMNHRVLRCSDGRQALEQFSQTSEEVCGLVFDIDLPNVDGIRCLETIRRQSTEPIGAVMISGRKSVSTDRLTRFLSKPLDPAKLGEALGAVLNVSRE